MDCRPFRSLVVRDGDAFVSLSLLVCRFPSRTFLDLSLLVCRFLSCTFLDLSLLVPRNLLALFPVDFPILFSLLIGRIGKERKPCYVSLRCFRRLNFRSNE